MAISDYGYGSGRNTQHYSNTETGSYDASQTSAKRQYNHEDEGIGDMHHPSYAKGDGEIGEESPHAHHHHHAKKAKTEESANADTDFISALMNKLAQLANAQKSKDSESYGKDDGDDIQNHDDNEGGDSGYGSQSPSGVSTPQNQPPVAEEKSVNKPVSAKSTLTPPPATTAGPTPTPEVKASDAKTSPTSAATPAAGAKPFDPATQINAKDFGVDPANPDNQTQLTAAIKAANAAGKELYLGEGTFNHSGVLDIGAGKLTGAGPSTVLHATNPDNAALKISGDGGSISNLKTTVNAGNRSSQPDASAILVQGASNASVTGVVVQGASANGIRLDRANSANISSNMVTGTNADGIALMNGSTNNTVKKNVIDQAADDALSSDSYNGDAIQNSNNTFEDNLIQNSRYGRAGVSMGGANDKFLNNTVNNAPDHSPILTGTDASSGTMTGSGGVISGNQVNTGNSPTIESVLGFDPGKIADASAYSSYVPGTGPGANNTEGNRS